MQLLADENFNADIVSGLRQRKPNIELIRVQEVGLDGVRVIQVTGERQLVRNDGGFARWVSSPAYGFR